MARKKKPEPKLTAGEPMDALLGKLLQVPKTEADSEAARWKKQRSKRKTKTGSA